MVDDDRDDRGERSSAASGSAGTPSTADLSSLSERLADAFTSAGAHPDRVGPYKILEVLGEGGMGVVFLAEQREPVRRRVALKLIKLGMDTREVVARFEAERQALAMMDHPNVSRVYDAGATEDGRPYFVMEHVEGVPITEYCDSHRLSIRERLELLVQVCHGVAHAHHRGIVHRDLKPSNILISASDERTVAKIIDFGVARATNQSLTEKTIYTEIGRVIGTPAYMSPEQAATTGERVDHRSDVYSLGVILYELLISQLPIDLDVHTVAMDEVVRRLREEEPPTPSTRWTRLNVERTTDLARKRRASPATIAGDIRGDLDWITMKAMDKDRDRRYSTARALADDIGRYLDGEPVEAGPPSAVYRLRKFVKRNRFLVASTAAVFLALAAGVVASSIFAFGQMRALAEVERQRKITEAVNRFFNEDILAQADPENQPNRDIKLTEVLDGASERIDEKFLDEPDVRAAILLTLAKTRRTLSEYSTAELHLKEALAILLRQHGERHPPALFAMDQLGLVYRFQGQFDQAEKLYKRALRLRQEVLGADHPDTFHTYSKLATLYAERGFTDKAEEMMRDSLERRRRVLGPKDRFTLVSMNNLALLCRDLKKHDEALRLFSEALEVGTESLGEDHPNTLTYMVNLALVYTDLGRFDEAAKLCEKALAIRRRVLGENHRATFNSAGNLAGVYLEQGRFEEAAMLFESALAGLEKIHPDGHWMPAKFLTGYGRTLAKLGRHEEAERSFLEAHRVMVKLLGSDHQRTRNVIEKLVAFYGSWGKAEEAARWRERL